ncbi:MAG: TadE/TadG family type IV pilus assembly protein [Sphingomicrobium sp.]
MIGPFLKSLRSDERGAAVIELALVAPILATMTIGVIDLSNAFSRKLALEQAAQRGVEKVMQTTGELKVEDTMANEASTAANVPVSQVTVTFTMTCNGVATAASTECADDSTEVRYTELNIWDTYTPVIPFKFAGMQSDGTYRLTAKQGIRTK